MANTFDRKRGRATFLIESLEDRRMFAFGLTTTGTSYVVDTGGGLTFTVLRAGPTSSTVHLGDLTSVKYNGTETLAPYSATGRYSHYEEGLGSSTTVTGTEDDVNGVIEIAATDPTLGVTQYYIARRGYDAVYMATYAGGATPPSPGEMRFITYLSKSVFNSEPAASNITGDNAIEGSDVFQDPITGYTASKFYGANQFIVDPYHGVTGPGVGAFMTIGSHETSSGGPFFKDINFQTTGSAIEMYNYMYSGHLQTEAFRPGLQGPYALNFTNGGAPGSLDFSFMDSLNLLGQVPASGRGSLAGTASGVPTGRSVTVGLANGTAEYWARADATTGQYLITGIKPGTYTETLYQDELAVGTQTVTISAGTSTAANIQDTLYTPSVLWTIGSWDGTPLGFLNADKITTMHPSDPRMARWTNVTYTVGTTPDSSWPLEQWKDVNNNNQINFNLDSSQASTPLTLRIGISLAQYGARPQITVNSGQSYSWTSSLPAGSSQPNSRGITRGTWRGNNTTFTYNIPTSSLRAGSNTINISVNSGQTGTGYLSPGITYDAIDLVPTSSLTNAPVLTRIAVTPANPNMALNSSQTFSATAFDQFNNPMPANVTWSASNGTVDGTGRFTASGAPATATITATSGSTSGQTSVNVIAASASSSTVAGMSVGLTVLGDSNAAQNLTYTWASSGPAPVTFSANGTSGSRNVTATFAAAGNYSFTVTATDAGGLSVSSAVSVTVTPTPTTLAFAQQPSSAVAGATMAPVAVNVLDQFNNVATAVGSTVTLSGDGKTFTADAINGVATFSTLSLTTAGTYNFAASDSALASATSASFTIDPAAASQMIYLQLPPASIAHGTSFTVKVELLDPYGNLATNNASTVTLYLGAHPTNGVLNGTRKHAVYGGIATFNGLSFSIAGTYTIAAYDSLLSGGLTSANIAVS